MREIFSVRFFIAIGAVAGLLFLLFTFFVARDVVDQAISDNGADAAEIEPRAIDLVDVVVGHEQPRLQFSPDEEATANVEFMLDPRAR